jgi:hypothetical protein
MAKTKFFTEQVTGGSPGDASAEDMMRGYSDAGRGGMRDEGKMFDTFFAPEESGGFLGRPRGWER